MKIVVCINHLPDTETKVRIGPDGKSIERSGVNYILNPYDEFAIEASLRLKEERGGETIAMSLGSDAHKESLRKALAMGVDKAILLKDECTRDSYSVARALTKQLRSIAPDCILFGKQSIDYYGEQVPGLVAEWLGLPSVSVVVRLEISNGKILCEREIEGGHELVEAALPVVIAAQKGLNEPRYPSLRGIMAAKGRPIVEEAAEVSESFVEVMSMHAPPTKQPGRIVGTDVSAVADLVRLLHEEAKVI